MFGATSCARFYCAGIASDDPPLSIYKLRLGIIT